MLLKLHHLAATLATGLLAQPSEAQTATAQIPPPPEFDVASLKPSQPLPPYPVNLGTINHGIVTLQNVTLTQCLRFAFDIRNDRQIDGPDWIKDHNVLFSITAKAEPETTKEQIRTLMATLLTKRFQMTLHHEQRELPFLAVTADPKRFKLPDGKAGAAVEAPEFHNGRIVLNNVSIKTLLVLIGQFTSATMVDQTGLTGVYDVKLEWAVGNTRPSDATTPPDPQGPTLFDAIEEQLGLKLDKRKGPMDVLVVDHAEKSPIEN